MNSADKAPLKARGVVIGVDGSPGSRHAMDWLVHQNALGLDPVVPVMAYELPATADGLTPLGMIGDDVSYVDDAEELLKAEVLASGLAGDETSDNGDSDEIDAILSEGRPGPVLVDEGSKRELIVVGCRGRSTMAEIVLGSVSSYCVMHATVPVAIIPKTTDAAKPIQRIVVGVDGSSNSQAALQWAVDHAYKDCTIDVISVYSLATFASMGVAPSASELAKQSQKIVDAAIASVTPREDMPHLEGSVLEGDPRNSLRLEAEKADLIVLGSRGHKGVAHLLLGSVATSLTHHPTAATVVVPA